MNRQEQLQQRIAEEMTNLRALLSRSSTYSVAGSCFTYLISPNEQRYGKERLTSPQKQVCFMLGALLSGREPPDPVEFGLEQWAEARVILEALFHSYMTLYMPSKEEFGKRSPERHRTIEVSMLALLHSFNNGMFATIEQVIERITIYLVPFDTDVKSLLGISATQAIQICKWTAEQLQHGLDDCHDAVEAASESMPALSGSSKRKRRLSRMAQEVKKNPSLLKAMTRMTTAVQRIGIVGFDEMNAAFPDTASIFWKTFTVGRGEGPEINYPTEESVVERRPLIRISDKDAFCPSANLLFNAVLLLGERAMAKSSIRTKFLRARDVALEKQTYEKIGSLLGPQATLMREVYETPNSQNEHDVIAIDNDLCLIVEAKAAPPAEAFRDPERAFPRIRDAFRADSGIQKAFQQGNQIVRRLNRGETVTLFDAQGEEVYKLNPKQIKTAIAVCVTRDNFGALATDLSLLLEKADEDTYPWAVNIIDLSALAETWPYLKFGAKELDNYLRQRVCLHGNVFSDDELDYAGYFIKHGSFASALAQGADFLQLNPDYSSVFDQIYAHLHLDGPPVVIERSEPVIMDLRTSLRAGEPVFVDELSQGRVTQKVGRNAPCPCGSGKKYKKCSCH